MDVIRAVSFSLPSGAGGLAPAMARGFILKRVREFSEKHNLKFTSEIKGYQLLIYFENDQDYTLFFLAYDSRHDWSKPRMVDL